MACMQTALESTQKTNSELSATLADETASRILFSLKSKMVQIELEQSEEYIKHLKEQPEQDQLRIDNKNLSNDVQQHLLTIQQLTQQVQALTSLKRSRSTSEQPANDQDSAALSHATDTVMDTSFGLEGKDTADSNGGSTAVSKGAPTVRTVDLGNEDSYLMSQKSLRWMRALSPRRAGLQEEWVLRGLTLHQLKDLITNVYASKSKADARCRIPSASPAVSLQGQGSTFMLQG